MPDGRSVCGKCGEVILDHLGCGCPESHFCADCKGTGINKEQNGRCKTCSLIPEHLTVKKLKEALANLPDDYVVCMSADVPNGYVVGGTHYKVDQLSKAVFIIDATSLPEEGDTPFGA